MIDALFIIDERLDNLFNVRYLAMTRYAERKIDAAIGMAGVVNDAIGNNFTVRDNDFFIIYSKQRRRKTCTDCTIPDTEPTCTKLPALNGRRVTSSTPAANLTASPAAPGQWPDPPHQ